MTHIVIIATKTNILIGVDTRVSVRDRATSVVTHLVNNDTKLFWSVKRQFAIAISNKTFVFHRDHPEDPSKALSVGFIIKEFIKHVEQLEKFEVSNLIPTLLGKDQFLMQHFERYYKEILDEAGIYCVGFKADNSPYIGSYDFFSYEDQNIHESKFLYGADYQGLNVKFIAQALDEQFMSMTPLKDAAKGMDPNKRIALLIEKAEKIGKSVTVVKSSLALAHNHPELNKDNTIGDHYDIVALLSDGKVDPIIDPIPRHQYVTQNDLVHDKDGTLDLWIKKLTDDEEDPDAEDKTKQCTY